MDRVNSFKTRMPREKKKHRSTRQLKSREGRGETSTTGYNFFSSLGNQVIMQLAEGGMVQPKLNMSRPADFYEKQADRIAATILRSTGTGDAGIPRISRVPSSPGRTAAFVPEATETGLKNIKGKGRPLSRPLLDFFEPRFGVDLGNIRVHTGSEANTLAESVHARAFTTGSDIVFKEGAFQPYSGQGKALLAHELVHTVQQGQGSRAEPTLQRSNEPGFWDKVYSKGLKGAAQALELIPAPKFVPIPGFSFMANFMKGLMVGAITRLSEEDPDHLWQITKNTVKAVTSTEFMEAFFWAFLRGFFGDFILLYELPGMIEKAVDFIKGVVANLQELSGEDIKRFFEGLDSLKDKLLEGGSDYVQALLADIKAGRASDLLIETLKTVLNVPQAIGKGVGKGLTGVLLEYFSGDYKKIGKDLGNLFGEAAGMVTFEALLIAITAGAGSVWTAVRGAIATVKKVLLDGVAKAVKAVVSVFRKLARAFGKLVDGVKGILKGFGNTKLIKGLKGKLDDALGIIKKLIDDILDFLTRGRKTGKTAKNLKAMTALDELKSLPELSKMNKGQIQTLLKNKGYTRARAQSGGEVWTKALPDGNTAAVRIDPPDPKLPSNFLGAKHHVHKEIVPSNKVVKGNYPYSPNYLKFKDDMTPAANIVDEHILYDYHKHKNRKK